MPNVVGMWNPELSEESIREMLTTQLQRVRIPHTSYNEYLAVHPGFGAGLQDHGILENGVQPVHAESGGMSLILDGEVYNTDELKCRFRSELPPQEISPPELCLRLILKHGEDVVNLFNGLFCIVVYDRNSQRMTLISDRFGFRSLFFLRKHKSVIFGSELKALCAVDPEPRRIDEIGTLEFFCYGSHVIDRTWIEGYLRLPPATIMTVDRGGVRTRAYWVYKYDEGSPTLDQPTYFTAFSTLLDRAVERCMKGSHRIGIFLSGGYDSRSVAASIRKHHLPMAAFTFGHPQSRDIRYARMLAERLGLDHHALTDSDLYLYPNCRRIVWRTEGMCSLTHCTSIRYHTLLKEKMDVILTGFLGEFSGSHTWPQLLLARSRQAAITAAFNRMVVGRVGTVRRVFNPSFFERTFGILRARFEQSFDRVENDHPLNIVDCWNFIHLQPRGTFQTPVVDRHLFEVRAPHMDCDLVNFLLTIPPYSRLEQRVYKKMMAYHFPEIRDVPCANSGLPVNPHFAREYALMAARYLGRTLATPVAHLLGLQRSSQREFRDLDGDFRAEPELVEKILRPLLDTDIFPAHMFNRSAIDDVITEHYQAKGSHQETLSRLISWGLAVKYFLYDDFSDVPPDMYAP